MVENTRSHLLAHVRVSTYSLGGSVAGKLFPATTSRVATHERRIFLTFDDGPSPAVTPRVLQILRDFDATATFFVTSSNAVRHPDLINDIVGGGHAVGSHSVAHDDYWRIRARLVRADLSASCQEIEQVAGVPVELVRPPYGHIRPAVWRWCKREKKKCVLWDVMPGEFRATCTPNQLAGVATSKLKPGSIVVLHDAVDSVQPTDQAAHELVERRVHEIEFMIRRFSEEGWLMDQPLNPSPAYRTD